MKNKRPPGLVAIVFYKTFVASLLAVTSIALLLAHKNHQHLKTFSESYLLEFQLEFIDWLLDKLLNVNPNTLWFSGIAAGLYAVMTAIQAYGLWYEKAWARFLVLGVVGISLPLEIWELIKGITILKLVVFFVNLALFWYLLRHFPKHSRGTRTPIQ